jgi:branched-subunit amino acid ABC-type transport system permease component
VLPRRRARASSMLIYLVMAVVLVLRPAGLFPVAGK